MQKIKERQDVNFFKRHRPDHLAKSILYLTLTSSVILGMYFSITIMFPLISSFSKDEKESSFAIKDKDCIVNIIKGVPYNYGDCKKP